MRTQCKHGDLAVIIREEPGLDMNIGRLVWVAKGPFLDGDYGPVFLVQSASTQPIATLACDGTVLFTREADTYHPDAWMVPVWRPSPRRAGERRAPLRNLPVLGKAWLDAVMKGQA